MKIDLETVMKNLDRQLQQMGRKRFTKSYLMGKPKEKGIIMLIIRRLEQ